MKGKMLTKIGCKLGKLGLTLKKHESEILVVAGVAGGVASTVLACRATLKVDEVIKEHKHNIDVIHATADDPEYQAEYTRDDEKDDVRIQYIQTVTKVIKLYTPAVIIGGLSIAAIFTSNNILRKRNVALMSAYAAIDKSFKEYRGRVVEKYGEDVDKQLRYGTTEQTITETEVDPETGKEKKVKKKVKVADPNLTSDYAMYFDTTTSAYATDETPYNTAILSAKQTYWTIMLQQRGYVTPNEVLTDLGIEATQAGMVVGWYYDKNDEKSGDPEIDFRVDDNVYIDNHDGTYRRTIVIDPNVQGEIFTLMEGRDTEPAKLD